MPEKAKSKILIVEDEGVVAKDIQGRLERLGYAIVGIAYSGDEAVETAGRLSPDLVLMDIKLRGDMDGIEAARQIRDRFNIPVIYLTAYADDMTLKFARTAEPYGYIVKPFGDRELHSNIDMALYKYKAEKALRKSEEKYRTLYETTRDGIAGGPMDGRVLECNQAFADMLGYSREELSHLTYQQLTPKRWHQMEAEIVEEQILKRDYSDEYEKEYIRKDGTVFPISARVWLVRDKEGKPVGMWGIVRDITERKKAEEELKQSKEFLANVINALDDPVFVKDEEHRWVILNDAACKVMGRSREELIGKTDYDLFPEEQADVFWERDTFVLKNGQTDVNEEEITWHGKLHTISTKKSVFTDSVTGKKFIAGTIRDITERKKAEEAVRKERDRAQKYLDVAAVMLVAIDVEERVGLINKKGCEILGYKEEEIIGKNWFDNFLPQRIKHQVRGVFEKLVGPEADAPEYYENPILTKDGDERLMAWHNTVLRDDKGEVIATLGSGEDITERKRAEEELRLERDNFINILDSMEDGVYIVGQNYDIQYVNPVLKKDFGPYEERKCYEYFHDRKEVCSWCKNEEVFAGKTVRWEWYSSKNQRTYDLIDTPLRNPDGTISKLEIFRDITERKRAEERIRGQSEFLRNTIESLSHPFYVIDANDYTIKMANTAAGGAEALPEGMTCYALTHRLDKPCAGSEQLCPVEKIKKTKKPEVVEHTHYDKDGEKRIFEVHAYPIFDEAGNVSQVIEYSLDITERKRAEEALRRSQKDWENTFNAISDWVVLMDLKGRILRTNRAGEEFVGVPMAQIAGQTCCKLLHGSETPLPGCPLLKMLQNGRSGTMELQLPDSNRWLAITVDPVIDEKGTLAGAVHIASDITERKHAEQERESTISLLHLLNTNNHIHELMKVTMVFLKDWSDCEAVGIRFQDGDDFPYFETSGFPEEFVLAENKLCSVNEAGKLVRDSQGRPYLECMCGNVISGRFDPSKYFFTEHGSFWVNSTTQLLAGTTETDRLARTRNRCNTAGYESLALVPLRAGKETFGLLQFNDKQRGRFTPEKISLLERLADNLAIGLAQRRAEEALRESQQSLVRAQQMAHIGDWDRDFVENTVKWSEELYRIFGVSPDDFEPAYKGFLNLVHPDDRELVSKITTNAASGKQPFSIDYRIVRPDGAQCAVHSQGEVHTDNNGRVSRICGTVQDITERKKAEETLKNSEQKYKGLIETAIDGYVMTNMQGKILDCNKAFLDMIGYTMEEAKKLSYQDITPQKWHKIEEEIVKSQFIKRGYSNVYEKEYIRKDGTVFPISVRGRLIKDEKGQAIGMWGFIRDITERKQAEEALAASELNYRSLFDNSMEGIGLSKGNCVISANKALLDIFGYDSIEEFTKIPLLDHVAPESREMVRELMKKREKGVLAPSSRFEYRILRKDGQIRDLEISRTLISIEGEQFIQSTFRDITERKQVEQKLLDDQAQLKSLASQLTLAEERERRRIASELHDHISQSLVISKMKLEALCKSGYGKELDKALDEVCNSLGQTIADTRSLTFDLSPPILYELGFEVAVAEWLTGQIRDKHDIKTEFEDDGQPKPLNDDIRVLLFRNVRELLINVVRHANAQNVKVSIRKVGKQIRVSVEDDGVGFDPAKVASMAAKRAEFGLFSIRERLEESGGHLEIESELSHGSRITMFAPLKGKQKTKRRQK